MYNIPEMTLVPIARTLSLVSHYQKPGQELKIHSAGGGFV